MTTIDQLRSLHGKALQLSLPHVGVKIRSISMRLANNGFASGLQNGLSATDDIFDTPVVHIQLLDHAGLKSDVEVLRSDVRKAKAKLALEAGIALEAGT